MKPRKPATVVKALAEAMARCPELRVGQLIDNATDGDDIFYLEDDDLILRFDNYPVSK